MSTLDSIGVERRRTVVFNNVTQVVLGSRFPRSSHCSEVEMDGELTSNTSPKGSYIALEGYR